MLHCGDAVLGVMRGVGFAPHIAFSVMAKKHRFCLIRVFFGVFVDSLINALLAWSVSFGGRPSLGRFVVVPYSFNF